MKRRTLHSIAIILGVLVRGGIQTYGATAGNVLGWGRQVIPVVQPGTRFTAIAGGNEFSLALKADGTVVAWGDNWEGQSTLPEGLNGVVAIAAGTWHSLALKSDGTVVAWGRNWEGQSTVPDGLSGVVAIAGENEFSLALKSDGTVVAWGAMLTGSAMCRRD